jgi:hypothetical protein
MKPAIALVIVACCYAVVSEMDYRDAVARETEARELRNWIVRNCIPTRPNERGVIEVRQNGKTQCSIFENAQHGSAPRLVFAEVRE